MLVGEREEGGLLEGGRGFIRGREGFIKGREEVY